MDNYSTTLKFQFAWCKVTTSIKIYGQLLILGLLRVYLCALAKLQDGDTDLTVVAFLQYTHAHSLIGNFHKIVLPCEKRKSSTPCKKLAIQ